MGKWILLIVGLVGLVLVTLFASKYIMLYVTIAGLVLTMLFANTLGYWIEKKVQNWQLRRSL